MSVQPPEVDSLSTVFIWVPVTSPLDPSDDPVSLAFITSGKPIDSDWNAAEWDDRAARILVGPGPGGLPLTPATYAVWVKITDDPEIPVIPSGSLIIT